MLLIITFLSLILFDGSQGTYPTQKCYVCTSGCDQVTAAQMEACPSDLTSPKSGNDFASKALNAPNVYGSMPGNFATFVNSLGLNSSAIRWEDLTRYVCYVSKNKQRGCLVMGKGLCDTDKSWLGRLTSLGDKISSIMQRAKNSVASMFSGSSFSSELSNENKTTISNWIATNYFTPMVNNTGPADSVLETCCEGDACNDSAMIKQSMLICFTLLGLLWAMI